MKTFILITLIASSVNLFADELQWVDKQIDAIKPPRTGLNTSTLSSVNDPFIFLTKNKPEKKEKTKSKVKSGKSTAKVTNTLVAKKKFSFSLAAVINKSALISGNWYKVGEIVNGYKLAKVQPTSVVLTRKKKKLVLSTKSTSKNLNFKNNK